MNYDFVAIPDEQVPRAANPLFQHVVTTYASETNKTVSMRCAVPDDCVDFKPHEKLNTIRTIMADQVHSRRERVLRAGLELTGASGRKPCCRIGNKAGCQRIKLVWRPSIVWLPMRS